MKPTDEAIMRAEYEEDKGKDTKSYAILRYRKEIMKHLQECPECAERILAHIEKVKP